MDLVDIDQVLDNLELREAADENNKAAIQRNRLLPQTDVNECRNSEYVASTASASPTQSALGKASNSGASVNKGFVGVSQVLNSLDDYCKNVEGLETASQQKYDEECRLINHNYPTSDTIDRDPEIKVVHNSLNYKAEQDNKHSVFANSPETPLSTVINDGRLKKTDQRFPDDDEEEEEASNDIHKFIESTAVRHSNNFNDVDDTTTVSSDSLTTSSSSTFSSGPSPGLESITDEQSPLSPIDDEFEDGNAMLTIQKKQNKESQVETNGSVLSNDAPSSQPEESAVALDDLAAGLSSISITTANSQLNVPCEASISSVLQNVLEDLSETTTTSLLSQMRDDCVIAEQQKSLVDSRTFPSISLSYPEEKQAQFTDNAKYLVANANITKVSARTDSIVPCLEENKFTSKHQQQPITFGSTMDEISDTELDSMLQEMDIDDVAMENIQTASKPNTTSNQVIESITVMPKSLHTTKTAATSDSMENSLDESNLGDCLNADSFSQASTVEFSEIKAQAMQHPQAGDIGQSSNSIASSYSSSESSIDRDVMQLAEAVAEREEDVEYSDAHSNIRPQRPTTLDLPKAKTTLYTNAGQTPLEVNELQDNSKSGYSEQVPENELPVRDSSIAAADNEIAEATGYSDPHANLGKIPPIWVPDNMATGCMQCQTKFTMIKRRHHCRACGKVLCSVCCSQKFKLEFLTNSESRVCVQCYLILTQFDPEPGNKSTSGTDEEAVGVVNDGDVVSESATGATRSPNPNNPMEYCSTIPPHRQVSAVSSVQVPSVVVPVGVLKKDGSYSSNSSNSSSKQGRKRKSVMFSDGIAPGSDLASMEHQWSEAKHARRGHQQGEKTRSVGSNKSPTPVKSQSSSDATAMGLVAQLFRGSIPPMAAAAAISTAHGSNGLTSLRNVGDTETTGNKSSTALKAELVPSRSKRLPPSGCDEYGSFIPKGDNCLPPICFSKDENSSDFDYMEVTNNYDLIQRLQRETLKFAVKNNFFVYVKIVNLKCCMNRTVINFTTYGMHHVGNDELIILLEIDPPASKELTTEPPIPNDIFIHLQEIYTEAALGHPIAELSYTSPRQSKFLGSRDYGGFIFIRATFQCLQDVIVPENPFLIGILIHRHEVPWAKVFPLRLMLRLGAQYRYYPCPHISMRNRQSVYAEIAQTIINFLADFRNYSYTLPCIRGMYIHMEDRQTTVLIPRNRLEDVIKAINNSSDHILAFGGNFSKSADGHLVCMQNVNDDRTEMYAYSTQAINIQGQARKVTGASFIVLNEALKSTSGLSGKCSIVEDGLMVQILPSKMEEVRNSLRNQKDIHIVCGPLDADEQQTEIVTIKWMGNDRDFNIGVVSPIDKKSMEGVSSMRVNANFNYSNANYSIRLTDIYIIKYEEWYNAPPATLATTSLDVTRIAEQIARSASMALVPFLDLLVASGNSKIALRATLHQDIVCYEAGARGTKLPPLYMNALDSHLIPTLHNESSSIEDSIILELVFYILNV